MHPIEKGRKRTEQILLSLANSDYLTVKQFQRMHDLKSDRNAYRVIKRLEPYMNVFRDDGVNVYHLNERGREYVNSSKIRTKLTSAKHYIMRNDLYIHLGCPDNWKNEVKWVSGEDKKQITVIPDARFVHNKRMHIVEIDNLQKMNKNRIKIDKYRRLIERNSFKGMPVLIWVTTSEFRRKSLLELCEGLDVKVFLNTDFK